MTEAEAKAWLAARYPAAAIGKLERYVQLLSEEAQRQSLIARSTIASIWSRHIVDSAQLVDLASSSGCWLDIGSGGGLPGLVVAVLRDGPMVLSEPRRKRSDFLTHAIETLSIEHTTVFAGSAQTSSFVPAVVSARAVASISEIFTWMESSVSRETQFLLPRGRSWEADLAIARRAWHGSFHVEPSLTDPDSGIVVARAVLRR